MPEEFDAVRDEKCKFVPFPTLKKVTAAQGRVKSQQFCQMEQDDKGDWFEDEEQVVTLKCDFIISAFGSGLFSAKIKETMPLVRLSSWGGPEMDVMKMTASEDWVFCGGDLAGVAETAVEAVNNDKIVARSMHKYLQGLHGRLVPGEPVSSVAQFLHRH